MEGLSFLMPLLALCGAPLLSGVINKVKAFFAGRRGPSIFQLYFDLIKLLKKGVVYGTPSSWIFRIAPCVLIAVMFCALLLLPAGRIPSIVFFPGDFILFFYLLALARFFTVIMALDTGSAFEGMGASREAFFGCLSEVAVFISFLFLVYISGEISLTGVFSSLAGVERAAVELLLIAISLFFVLLAENSRIPVDDPNTHLELTMIHEVMILDTSGPDLAIVEYASALKLWMFCQIIAGFGGAGWFRAVPTGALEVFTVLAGIIVVAALVGLVESTMARLRLSRVPQFIAGAWVSAGLAMLFVVMRAH